MNSNDVPTARTRANRRRPLSGSLTGATVASLLALFVSACQSTEAPSGAGNGDRSRVEIPGVSAVPADPSETLAIVNGEPVPMGVYRYYVSNRESQRLSGGAPGESEMTQELINLVLLAQRAETVGLASEPAIANRIQLQRESVLASAMIEHIFEERPVTNKEVKDLYQQRFSETTQYEYKARNILVSSREQAQGVIQELEQGADFATLARTHSTGPAARVGGALEWFRPQDVLPRFAEAVARLQPGSYSRKPVRTRYGWNVILLEERREIPAPDFKDVAEALRQELMQQRIEQFVDELRQQASVDLVRKP